MSAFLHSDTHINTILCTALALGLTPITLDGVTYNFQDLDDRKLIGKLLRAENVRSVNKLYSEHEPLEDDYQYRPEPAVTALACFKAIDSLDYQSCETRDWRTTRECRLLELMQVQLAALVPYPKRKAPYSVETINKSDVYITSPGWSY